MTVSRCVITSTPTGADTAAVSLALEEDRKAHEPEPVDTKPVDPAVTALPGDVHAVEVGFAQQPPGQPLESIGWHVHELFKQLFFPAPLRQRLPIVWLAVILGKSCLARQPHLG